jgi:hypothetical protein
MTTIVLTRHGHVEGIRPERFRGREDLRAAINHHRREGLCSEIVSVVLPPRTDARERWLTRSEAARLLWAAWRARQVMRDKATMRRFMEGLAAKREAKIDRQKRLDELQSDPADVSQAEWTLQ